MIAKHRWLIVSLAVLVLLGTGGAGKIQMLVDPSAPFGSYRTFKLDVSTPAEEDDPTGNRRRLHDALTESITADLQRKGLAASDDQPDLIVVYTGYTGAAAAGGVMTGAGAMRGWLRLDLPTCAAPTRLKLLYGLQPIEAWRASVTRKRPRP